MTKKEYIELSLVKGYLYVYVLCCIRSLDVEETRVFINTVSVVICRETKV